MNVDLSLKTVANHPDPQYTTGLLIGLIITILSAAVILYRAKKNIRPQSDSGYKDVIRE